MNVWVPYTKIQPGTAIALKHVTHRKFQLVDEIGGYPRFLQARWEERKPFINVEHDTVFWSSSLQELWDCEEPWCGYGYWPEDDFSISECPYMGCVKFGEELIVGTQGVWDDKDDWLDCDGHLYRYATPRGFKIHQHYPNVVNANPLLA